MSSKVRVLFGLGNPGAAFDWTRHNVGFSVMDLVAASRHRHFELDEELHGRVAWLAPDVLLVKPETGMNDSGKCVRAVLERFVIARDDTLVVYDDVSLPTGRLRFRASGSSGGHHGLDSIAKEVQVPASEGLPRLRVAVGPDPGGETRARYVLTPLTDDARARLERVVELASAACLFWLDQDFGYCMNAFNSRDALSI